VVIGLAVATLAWLLSVTAGHHSMLTRAALATVRPRRVTVTFWLSKHPSAAKRCYSRLLKENFCVYLNNKNGKVTHFGHQYPSRF